MFILQWNFIYANKDIRSFQFFITQFLLGFVTLHSHWQFYKVYNEYYAQQSKKSHCCCPKAVQIHCDASHSGTKKIAKIESSRPHA